MDNGVSACSPGPVVEASDSTQYLASLVAERLEMYPSWSGAKAEGLENPPPYTDGPSHVVLANDGTKDCLALLLTPDLVAALNQTTYDMRALERSDGALEKIESDLIDLTCRANNVEGAIRNPRYQDRAAEMQLALEILQLRQQEAQERKGQLNIETVPVESSLKLARHQSQAILEEALLDARLLDPPEPASPSTIPDADDDVSIGCYSDAPSIYEGVEPTPEQRSLREARMDAVARYETLKTSRARFDDRHADHDQKLAAFQRRSEAKADGARTHFDHHHIQHVRNLTRDLASAEQGYRRAQAKAKALETPAGSNDCDSNLGCRADGGPGGVSTMPDSDRERIEAWARGVPPAHDAEVREKTERVDLDDWHAGPVEMMDSISMIDCDGYVDEINDWKTHCRALRDEASLGGGRETDGLETDLRVG